MENYSELRSVKITYSNGDIIETSMAAHLTDNEILDYFKIGRVFNIGAGADDNLQQIIKTEIFNGENSDEKHI